MKTKTTLTPELFALIENITDVQLYRATDFEPERYDDGDIKWDGSAPGKWGGEIHCIAQNETDAIYGETTDNLDNASYMVFGDKINTATEKALFDFLDTILDGGRDWPDNYAQCDGYYI